MSAGVLIHGDMGLASRKSRWLLSADVLPDTDVSTFAPWTLTRGRLSFAGLKSEGPLSIAQGPEPAAVENANQ